MSVGRYDNSKEEGLLQWARDFYSREFLSRAVLVWVWGIAFIALAVYSALQFFKSSQTQEQVMWAALFVVAFHGLGLMKVLAWLMLLQHGIRRDLKRMELRIAQLHELVKSK